MLLFLHQPIMKVTVPLDAPWALVAVEDRVATDAPCAVSVTYLVVSCLLLLRYS